MLCLLFKPLTAIEAKALVAAGVEYDFFFISHADHALLCLLLLLVHVQDLDYELLVCQSLVEALDFRAERRCLASLLELGLFVVWFRVFGIVLF